MNATVTKPAQGITDGLAELMAGATTGEFLEAVRALARLADEKSRAECGKPGDGAIMWAHTRDRLAITALRHGTARVRGGK